MKKTFLVIMALFLLLSCGSAFAQANPSPASPGLIKYKSEGEIVLRIQLRLRELGYFCFKPTGKFQSATVDSAIKFQQLQLDANGQSIMADGSIGAQSMAILFSRSAVRTTINAGIPIGKALTGVPTITGTIVSWDTLKEQLTKKSRYLVTDYNTGTEFYMTYLGGENHAEMECSSTADTDIYKEVFGGEYNYSKRPMVISVNGTDIAASLQGFPHGDDTLGGNGMSGHACMYFDGSLSHVGSLPDVEHITQVYKAAGSA